MALIYLDDNQTRQLFLNKYLEAKDFKEGNKPLPDYNSFEFAKNKASFTLPDKQVIFLSQFNSAIIKSENERNIFNRNYDIPIGFLELGKSNPDNKFKFDNDSPEIQIDSSFLTLRRALLHSFLVSFNGRDSDFKNWFSLINNLIVLPEIVDSLIPLIIELKDFPQIEMTAKFSKNTKLELQFIYLGRIMGEIYFKDNNNKTDDAHRDWLLNLNPEKDISVNALPFRFIEDAGVIIGYILALKFATQDRSISLNDAKKIINELAITDDVKNKLEEILFYCFFWMGMLNLKLNNYFHTSLSSEILLGIENKSYQLIKKTQVPIFELFNEKVILEWSKYKAESINSRSKRFTEYCKMHSGEIPKERTEKQIIEKIEPYNLLTKKVLIVFFKDDSSLIRLWEMLHQLQFITNVLLVYKQYVNTGDIDSNLENDLLIGSIKKQFAKNYSKVHFEIISKNIIDIDDRDVINNLKGYMRKYCSESNFVYLTDSKNEKDSYRENLWLASAFSNTPIFSKEESYLFIS